MPGLANRLSLFEQVSKHLIRYIDQICPEEILIWTEMEHMDPMLYKMCFVKYLTHVLHVLPGSFACYLLKVISTVENKLNDQNVQEK